MGLPRGMNWILRSSRFRNDGRLTMSGKPNDEFREAVFDRANADQLRTLARELP